MGPENRPPQSESRIPTIHFKGQTVSFREGIHQIFSLQELPKLITSNGVAWLGVTWEMLEVTIRDCCVKGFLAREKLDFGPSKFDTMRVWCGLWGMSGILNGDALSD